ncbi:hypothetical protein V2J09_001457 [Rumex salicifolius]
MASSTQKSQITVAGGGSGPAVKGKGKKGGKQGTAGKKPGRGMGVAQLERIRVQESWKLISDLNPVPVQTGFGVPIRCGELHEINGGVYAVHPQGFVQGAGPTGLFPTRPNTYFPRPGFLHVDPVHSYCGPGDQNRVRILNGLNGGGFRPEMPSHSNPDHLDFNTFSFKKKRVSNGEDFVGNKFYQGVEILAVHRKGVGTRNMVMEYGFFPANSSSSTTSRAAAASASTYRLSNVQNPADRTRVKDVLGEMWRNLSR